MAATAPWAIFNAHRTREQPPYPLTDFLSPSQRARWEAAQAIQAAASAPAAPIQAAARPGPLRPAWAKSGEEIFMKLDAISARMQRGGVR